MKKETPTAGAKTTSGKKQMNENSLLSDFFHDELKDIYWAEKQLVKTLPKLQKAATTEELQNAFADHLEQTKEHVARLEDAFEKLGAKPQAKKCDSMEGIVKEGEEIIESTEEGSVTRDVGLIMAAQKAEHYEISTYGGLAQVAETLGYDDIAKILRTTLEEEKNTDALLTEIAEDKVNYEALEETE